MRLLCWLGKHKWKFKLNFIERADYDGPRRDTGHYSGTCERCGTRDLLSAVLPKFSAEGGALE
jgi:hypothetical protein